jgi:hypothetical protein
MIRRFFFWPLFFICQLLALSLLSWHALAQIDFAYPTAYQLLRLDETIATYAPQNLYKRDFETTSAPQHWQLFAQIVDAVQSGGRGLAEIHYPDRRGQPTALLTEKEIVHLQDVAHLIDRFYAVAASALLLWLGLVLLACRQRWPLPPLPKVLAGFACGLTLVGLIVLGIGPQKIFYWLHTVVFPAEHQWFFYYYESLMTTLMKAPDLFAFIAALLLGLLVACWCLAIYPLQKLLPSRPRLDRP